MDEQQEAKRCPVDGTLMDPRNAWWWTENGAACSEGCARELVRRDSDQ